MGVSHSTTTSRRRGFSHPYPFPPHSYPLDCYHSSYLNPDTLGYGHGNSSSSPPLYFPPHHTTSAYPCSQPHFGSFDSHQQTPVESPPGGEQKPAKVVNSDINVHKDSLKLEIDEMNSDHYLVSFVFDALLDGCFTVYYFAREVPDRRVVPFIPEVYVPIKVPFRKGLHQEFRQPPGTGIAWHLFAPGDLSRSSLSRDDVFPIIISAETSSNPYMVNGGSYYLSNDLPQVQITMVILDSGQNGNFDPKVVKQLLWTDDTCYELREIYGLGKPGPSYNENDNDNGKECVICMTEPKYVAVLPCRHMCMCSGCAKELRNQSNKCPICRETIESLLEIKMGNGHR